MWVLIKVIEISLFCVKKSQKYKFSPFFLAKIYFLANIFFGQKLFVANKFFCIICFLAIFLSSNTKTVVLYEFLIHLKHLCTKPDKTISDFFWQDIFMHFFCQHCFGQVQGLIYLKIHLMVRNF